MTNPTAITALNSIFVLTFIERSGSESARNAIHGPSIHLSANDAYSSLWNHVKYSIVDRYSLEFLRGADKKEFKIDSGIQTHGVTREEEITYLSGDFIAELLELLNVETYRGIIDWYFKMLSIDNQIDAFYEIKEHPFAAPASVESGAIGHLKALIADVDAAGGLIAYSDGSFAPEASDQWTDLGASIHKAKNFMDEIGDSVSLKIDSVEYTVDEVDDRSSRKSFSDSPYLQPPRRR